MKDRPSYLLLATSLVLGLGVLEAGCRLFFDVTDVPFAFWDPVVGPRKAPRQEGRYMVGDYMHGRYRFNAQGWNHTRDYRVARVPGRLRIALVGDSHVEALQVDVENAMFAVAEERMRADGHPAEWYAFGMSGYGTAQEYELIRRYVLDYRPDLVILLFVQNDPFDTSPYLGSLEPYYVRYTLDAENNLLLASPEPWSPRRWRRLAARSALVRYYALQRQMINRFKSGKTVHGIGAMPLREDAGHLPNDLVPEISRLSTAERQEATWRLIERLFEAARDECRLRGSRFAIAFRGWDSEIGAPLVPETAPAPAKELDPYCLHARTREMGREWVGPIARRLGIPYLDLTDAIRNEVARTGISHRFPDDGHYSGLGHRAAGEALAAWATRLTTADASPVTPRP
jgi:hypothetical protein